MAGPLLPVFPALKRAARAAPGTFAKDLWRRKVRGNRQSMGQ